jgi:acetaldehyde dehydrogenase/alcohol dehydrogenase
MPRSLSEVGVPRDEFERALPDLCRAAFEDPSGRTNPRMPMLAELTALLEAGCGA